MHTMYSCLHTNGQDHLQYNYQINRRQEKKQKESKILSTHMHTYVVWKNKNIKKIKIFPINRKVFSSHIRL